MSFERDNVRRMTGYASGEQPLDTNTIKLNTNENPYPPSPAVGEVLGALTGSDLRRYPPPTANAFRDAAADRHGVTRDHIIATRGGDELLRLVITTFVNPGDTIAMTDPTYSLYPVLAQIHDCPVLKVPLTADWQLPADFAAQANARGARLTLLVNPHAPSGRLLSISTLRDIAGSLNGLLLLDEAYVDFIEPTIPYESVQLVDELPNVIILRTLSKGYALAGLRFGYGIAAPDLIAPMLGKTRDSYNLDYISQKIAEAAFSDQGYARELWAQVRSERVRLQAGLSNLGLQPAPSQSNFLLVTVPAPARASDVYESLKAGGILVRYFDEPRLADKLRITVGTPTENDRLLAALATALE